MSNKDTRETRANSNDDKTPRELETRKTEERPKVWKMPTALELPEEAVNAAKSQGIVYHWVRESVAGVEDKTNVSKRFREGFVPVRPEELPGYHELPIVDDGRHAGVIGVGGLILCKIPKEIADQRNQFFEQQTQNQMTAVENDLMREENPAMPISRDMKSRVTFGGEKSS
jgi:hypothetical protein